MEPKKNSAQKARRPTVATARKTADCTMRDEGRRRRNPRKKPQETQDILNHIHSLVTLRDAARAACVSRGFLRSWRSFPNLTLNRQVLGLNDPEGTADESSKNFVDRIHHILQNHSGIGVKTLKLQLFSCRNVILTNYLDRWLEVAVKSRIVELAVELPRRYGSEHSFSCSLLSHEAASSLQSLSLSCCAFRPTLRISCSRSLTSVVLRFVHVTGEELGCFLSSTFALKKLALLHCDEMTFLRILSHLQQLSFLQVNLCRRLYMIESNAPKLTTVIYRGSPIKLSFGDSSQVRFLRMHGTFYSGMIQYARTKLPSIASNLRTLTVTSPCEVRLHPIALLSLEMVIMDRRNVWSSSAASSREQEDWYVGNFDHI